MIAVLALTGLAAAAATVCAAVADAGAGAWCARLLEGRPR